MLFNSHFIRLNNYYASTRKTATTTLSLLRLLSASPDAASILRGRPNKVLLGVGFLLLDRLLLPQSSLHIS